MQCNDSTARHHQQHALPRALSLAGKPHQVPEPIHYFLVIGVVGCKTMSGGNYLH